jgi:hypothetical protein
VNGDFSADLTSWTVVNEVGGSGNWFVQTGTTSPMSSALVPMPPSPTKAAMTDQSGPGSHVLYQDFVVPAGVTAANISFDRFRGNRSTAWVTAADLDKDTTPNQQARVDIITTTANPFSVAPADIIVNIFQTNPGDPLIDAAYMPHTMNITAALAPLAGQTVRLRFAEADNQGNFQFGIDNVQLNITAGPAGPGVTITQSGGSTAVTEGGATDTYTVVLNTAPTADVTVTINPGTQVTVAPATLTFTSTNWNVAQTVTVTAVDDAAVEGPHTGTISHTSASTDTTYNALTIASVTANITDNDAPVAGVTITQSGGSTAVTEGGATDTYTVVLNTAPTANVTVTINPGTQVTVAPVTLTFTTANWNTAQTVTVTAVDDALSEGTHSGTITHTAASTDAAYNGVAIASVTVSITDNDGPTAGGEGAHVGSFGAGTPSGNEGSFGFGFRAQSQRLAGPFAQAAGRAVVLNVSHRNSSPATADQAGMPMWALAATASLLALAAGVLLGKATGAF